MAWITQGGLALPVAHIRFTRIMLLMKHDSVRSVYKRYAQCMSLG